MNLLDMQPLHWPMHHSVPLSCHSLYTATMTEDLQAVYRHCVYNLDSVHPHLIPDIHFQFDGTNWVCSRALPNPLTFTTIPSNPITESALIFQVIGQISAFKPILTTKNEHQILTSCWIEACPDAASCALWSHIPESLHAIAQASHTTLNFSQLYHIDASGVMQLKVVWTGDVSKPALIAISTHCHGLILFCRHKQL